MLPKKLKSEKQTNIQLRLIFVTVTQKLLILAYLPTTKRFFMVFLDFPILKTRVPNLYTSLTYFSNFNPPSRLK